MACLGVHFALTDDERQALESLEGDEARIEHLIEVIEETCDEEFYLDTDKAWDAIHRCLVKWPPNTPWFYPVNNGEAWAMPEDHGEYPLKLAVLGGKRMISDEHLYFMRLIEPRSVPDIAEALEPFDKDELHRLYFKHVEGAWPDFGEDDFEYTWPYFEDMRAFFRRMAGTGRAILFAADQ